MIKVMTNIVWQRERKEFKISDVFEWIENSKAYHKTNLVEVSIGIPYVSRTNLNNWLETVVKRENNFILNPSNTIAFWAENADFFYQPYDYVTWNKMYYARSKRINRWTWLFLQKMLSQSIQWCWFWYWKWLTWTRLKNRIMLLPVDKSWTPDREYMEEIMKKIEQKILTRALQCFENKLQKPEMRGGGDLINKQWGEFFVEDIFDTIQRWKRLKKQDHIEWKIPYISSTATNNGVDAYIANTENIRKFNYCLTLANSGSIGATFYQPFSFIASDHVTKLENKLFSKYIYLFISTKLQKLGDKYSFNREINDKRIKREKMLLPIDDNYQPDYDFMDQYMRQIERRQIKKYIERKIGGIKKLSYNI